MQILPANILVSIPFGYLKDEACKVFVRINNDDWSGTRLIEWYGERLMGIEIKISHINEDMIQSLRNMRIRIIEEDDFLSAAGEKLPVLKELRPIFLLSPNRHLLKKVNFLCGLGFPVHIDASAEYEEACALDETAEFYLYNKLLTVSIEPFHSLIQTQIRGDGFTLWDTEYEKANYNFFVDEFERISLSPRWAASEIYFGRIENSWDKIVESRAMQSLISLKQNIFKKRNDCVFCAHFTICHGYLRAIVPDWPCQKWQSAFDILATGTENARKLLSRFDQEKKDLK